MKHVGWFPATSSALRLELLKLGNDAVPDTSDGKARPELQLIFSETVDRPGVRKTWAPANILKSVRLKQVGLTNVAEVEVSYCWNGQPGQLARIQAELLDVKGQPLPTRGQPLPATACGAAGGLQTGSLRVAFAGERATASAELSLSLRNHRGEVLAERRVPCAYTWPVDSIAITAFERRGVNSVRIAGQYNFNSRAGARLLFMPLDQATKAPTPNGGVLLAPSSSDTSSGPQPFSTLERGQGRFDWELRYSGWHTFTSSHLRAVLADADTAALQQLNRERSDATILDLAFFQIDRPLKLKWRSTLFGTIDCLGCSGCCTSFLYEGGAVSRDGEYCMNVKAIASLAAPGVVQSINGYTGLNLKIRSAAACEAVLGGLNAQKRERSGLAAPVKANDIVLLSVPEAVPQVPAGGGQDLIERWRSADRYAVDYFSSPVLTVQAVYADRPLPRARVTLHGTTQAGEAVERTRSTDNDGEVQFYEYETSGWRRDVRVDVRGPAGGESMDAQQKAILAELSFADVDGTPMRLRDEEQSLVADLTPPYYVGEIRTVTFNNDEDPTGTDEVFFLAAAKPGKGEKDRPQGLMWPIQTDSEFSWYESDGGEQISVNAPWFAFLPAQVRDKVYLGLVGMDNDVMPRIIGDLVNLFTKMGALVATAFGQVELAAVIQAAGELLDQIISKAEAEKAEELGRWVYELPKADLDRMAAANEVTSHESGNILVEYALSREKTPPLTRGVKVVLQEIQIKENGDWSDGEIKVFTRVCDRAVPRPDPGRPGESIAPCTMQSLSLGSVADGRTVAVNKTLFESDRLGPCLYIEVGTWDKDEPDLGDDNDLLGQTSVTFTASDNYGIGSTVFLTDGTDSGGPVTVRLLISER